jgi:hypothetical protein
LGGGGGTKLFCSQALNAAKANMAKAMREAALRFPAQFISRSSGSMHAGECLGFIFRAPFRFAAAKGFAEKGSPSVHSNNPLAVELESENDAACENLHTTFSSLTSI